MSLTVSVVQDSGCPESATTFYPGEDITLRLQLFDQDTEQKFVLDDFPVPKLTIYLPGNPQNIVLSNAIITIDPNNRSIITVNIPAATTLQMTTGNIRVVIDVGLITGPTDISLFLVANTATFTVNGINYDFSTNGLVNGTFQTALSGLARGDEGVVSDMLAPTPTPPVNATVISVAPISSSFLVQLGTRVPLIRMAQVRNGVKRLVPNPT